MATSPWYREGTAKFTEGSTTVTGTGTRWVDFVRAGDGIQGPDGKLYQVTNVASNTSMSITPAYGNETTYWTIPIQGYVKRLADAASQLVRDFEGGAVEAIDAADRAKQSATEAKASETAALSQANRAESEADRAETEADRAQQAADDAVAVVSGGEASIDPGPGKIPIAGAEGTIKQAWVDSLEFELDALRVAKNKALYGDGPYPVLDLQFQGAKILDPRITFTRATPDWDWNGKRYEANEPILSDEGLWTWPARTNRLTHSWDFGNSSWEKGVGVVVEGEGGYFAITNGGTGADFMIRTPVSENGPSTISLEVRPHTGFGVRVGLGEIETVHFDGDLEVTSTGSSVEKVIVTKKGLFSRVEIVLSSVRGGFVTLFTSDQGYVGTALDIKYVQLETGNVATPHIPTDGSQVTVGVTIVLINTQMNVREFTYIFWKPQHLPIYARSESWPVYGRLDVVGGVFRIIERPSTISYALYTPFGNNSNVLLGAKDAGWCAVRASEERVSLWYKGLVDVGVDSDSRDYSVTRISLSSRFYIRGFYFYDRALTDEQLQELTS